MTREEAIKTLRTLWRETNDRWYEETYNMAIEALERTPSAAVQPVQRGHWQEAKTRTYGIYECDVCKGWTYIPNEPRDYKFCPRCGADMRGEQNGTD